MIADSTAKLPSSSRFAIARKPSATPLLGAHAKNEVRFQRDHRGQPFHRRHERASGDIAKKDPRIVHLLPERQDLGIGGCWNEGVHHPKCGRFAIQLDSDDIYSGDDTLQRIVDLFRQENGRWSLARIA